MYANNNTKTKVISSIGWSTGSKLFRQTVQFFLQIIIARLLSPKDFGLFSMIVVFSGLADILRNLGLGASIIRSLNINIKALSSIFWFNIFAGSCIFLIFQLTASNIADFYNQPTITEIIKVFSIIYLIGSFNTVQDALLQKNLQFKRLFIIESTSVLIGGIIAIVLALQNFGVWTLVWQYLIITIINTILLWLTSSWKPLFHFSKKDIYDQRKFGINLVGHDLLSYFARNIDTFLIARYLGAAELGIYSRAYFLMLQPVNLTNQVLSRVMFPIFSRYQENHEAIKGAYIKSIKILSFIVFPLIGYCFVMAKPLITILLGNKWLDVVFIFQIFCIYSLIDTIGVTTSWIFKSTGNTNKMFKWGLINFFVLSMAIIAGLQWGIRGVAILYTFSFVLFLWLPGWKYCFKIINLKLKVVLWTLFPAFLSTILTGLTGQLIYMFIKIIQYPMIECLIILIAWIIFYLFYSNLFNKNSTKSYLSRIRKFIHRNQ